MSSNVLAIKYRPKRFEDLIGQDSISQTLSLALDSKRLSHAYLLSGLRGSGKTSTARIFSKALLCDNGPISTPCEQCSQCIMANEGRHIDIIEMDAASSRKIDDIRDVIEQTKYKPASSRFKIFIIDEVHMLTKEAFNALLKTLEEPPSFIKFILATTDPLKLPATILSRTQHFRFKKIPHKLIINHLAHILNIEKIEYQDEALDILARSGAGSLRDTLTLLDQAIIYSKSFIDTQVVTQMLGLIDHQFFDTLFNAFFTHDQEKITSFIEELQNYESELVIDELIAFLEHKYINKDSNFSSLVLERFFYILSDIKKLIQLNASARFILTLLFLKFEEALKLKDIDALIQEYSQELPKVKETKALPQTENKKELPPIAMPIKQEIKAPELTPENKKFHLLVTLILDRNAQLGQCFKDGIEYISYENNILTWMSCLNENCKSKLRQNWSIIKQFVQEVYGFGTKSKSVQCDREIKEIEKKSFEPQINEPVHQSCVTNCNESEELNSNNGLKEFNSNAILDDPMIKKAKELFGATKITIQNKV